MGPEIGAGDVEGGQVVQTADPLQPAVRSQTSEILYVQEVLSIFYMTTRYVKMDNTF